VIGMIDPNDSNANRVTAATLELDNLIPQVIDDAIDLLNHGLGQHLHLDPDLHGRYRTPRHEVTRIRDRRLAGNDFSECSVATSRSNTMSLVLRVQNTVLAIDHGISELRRAIDGNKIFVKMCCYEVALSRGAVLVDFAVKQSPKFR
jgi:hypothetical protein